MSVNPNEIKKLRTEQRNETTKDIDLLGTVELVRRLNDVNRSLCDAVAEQTEQIAKAVDVITDRMQHEGRLIFIGAGTSGRLGILDSSECPPTFSVSPDKVIGIISGGDRAIRQSVENAEDDPNSAKGQLAEVSLCDKDVVCGIAASGRTPYVLGALDYAKSIGAATIGVTNNKNSELSKHCDTVIEIDVGPEALSGSTRLKSGTSQKMVLNILTTASMVRQGKTYSNLMIDVKATNEKLRARCLNILREIFPEKDQEELSKALEQSNGSAKLAAVIIKL
ncbi:MAG: N-acetylmuramic acid 6-phosphate etherase, partial [Oscillospiraceae bacterium]